MMRSCALHPHAAVLRREEAELRNDAAPARFMVMPQGWVSWLGGVMNVPPLVAFHHAPVQCREDAGLRNGAAPARFMVIPKDR